MGVKGIFFGFTDRIGRANENLTLILSRSQREIVKHNFAQLEEEYGHLLSLSLVEVATLERYHNLLTTKFIVLPEQRILALVRMENYIHVFMLLGMKNCL